MPFALLLAFWAGFASLVPLVGATIGGIPYITVAFFQGWPIGVAAIIFLIVYQQIENNVFQPLIHRYTVQLNPLWIMLAVLIGANVLGIVGRADGHPDRRHRAGVPAGVVEHPQGDGRPLAAPRGGRGPGAPHLAAPRARRASTLREWTRGAPSCSSCPSSASVSRA